MMLNISNVSIYGHYHGSTLHEVSSSLRVVIVLYVSVIATFGVIVNGAIVYASWKDKVRFCLIIVLALSHLQCPCSGHYQYPVISLSSVSGRQLFAHVDQKYGRQIEIHGGAEEVARLYQICITLHAVPNNKAVDAIIIAFTSLQGRDPNHESRLLGTDSQRHIQ